MNQKHPIYLKCLIRRSQTYARLRGQKGSRSRRQQPRGTEVLWRSALACRIQAEPPGSWTRREETAGGSNPSDLAALPVSCRLRPITIRGVRRRAPIFTALRFVCTSAPKQAWVMAGLTVPARTHTPMYTRLKPASLHWLPHTHTHTHTKLPGLTPKHMYTTPVPQGEKGEACIPGSVEEPTLFRAIGPSCRARPF